jgi:hypothetical protein
MKVPRSAYGFGSLFLVLLAAVAVLPVVLRAIAPPCSEGFGWFRNPFAGLMTRPPPRTTAAGTVLYEQRYGQRT